MVMITVWGYLENDWKTNAGTDLDGVNYLADIVPVWTDENLSAGNGPFRIYSFYLYPEYSETISFLEAHGVKIPEPEAADASK